MKHHLSALALITLAQSLLRNVKDSDTRAEVVRDMSVLLDVEERAEFCKLAGLPDCSVAGSKINAL